MEVYDCIRRRVTVRKFRPDEVSDAVVARLLQAGRWAPSSRNQQPWHFIVIRDCGTLEAIGRIATSGSFIASVPLGIAIVMEATADAPELDAGRALQQMELMAWAEGMGTCFIGFDQEQESRVKDLLGVPGDMRLVTVLPLGYRAATGARPKRRNPMSAMAHSEGFGTAYTPAD